MEADHAVGDDAVGDAIAPGPTVPDEPVRLKAALRAALLAGETDQERSPDIDLGAWWWSVWGGDLESLGFGRARFDEALVAYRREVWLWLMGDRQWAQLATGLIGRIARRLPGTSPV